MENMPKTISNRLRELRSEHSCKIGMNKPVQVDGGVLYVPFYDVDDGSAPDEPLPLIVMASNGSTREVYGPSDEWFSLIDQIPD